MSKDIELIMDDLKLENMYFSKDEFLYIKKEEDSDYDSQLVRVTPNNLLFYRKINTDFEDVYGTVQISVDKDFSHMEISKLSKYGPTDKVDIITCINKGHDSVKKTVNKYDEDGRLLRTYEDYNFIFTSREEYIKEELIFYYYVVEYLYNYLEEFMPDISVYLNDINSDYSFLIEQFNKEQKNKRR